MIFGPDLAAKITQGKKTVTRRPCKRDGDGKTLACTYIVGRTYAVQLHRGGIGLDRVKITSVEREVLTFPISWTEAALEGFDTPQAFAERWAELYGTGKRGVRLPIHPTVWRIEFELEPS